MAQFGAKYPCFKPANAAAGLVLGKLVSANMTVNLATGEMYADDALDVQASEVVSANIAMETNDIEDEVAAGIYGATVQEQEVTYKTGDVAPEGILAYYKTLMKAGGVKSFRAYVYPCAKAAIGNDNAPTKGANITFSADQTTFTAKPDDTGAWRKTKTFTTEAEAKSYINTTLSIGVGA